MTCVDLALCLKAPIGQRCIGRSNIYHDGYYQVLEEMHAQGQLAKNTQTQRGTNNVFVWWELVGKRTAKVSAGTIVKAMRHRPRVLTHPNMRKNLPQCPMRRPVPPCVSIPSRLMGHCGFFSEPPFSPFAMIMSEPLSRERHVKYRSYVETAHGWICIARSNSEQSVRGISLHTALSSCFPCVFRHGMPAALLPSHHSDGML